MWEKYVKPKSVTWWSGFIPMIAGIFVAAEPIHGLQSIVASIDAMTGGITPSGMIIYGMTAIGLRGKDG